MTLDDFWPLFVHGLAIAGVVVGVVWVLIGVILAVVGVGKGRPPMTYADIVVLWIVLIMFWPAVALTYERAEIRARLRHWRSLQTLSWLSLTSPSERLGESLVAATLDEVGASGVDDETLMQQAFKDKLEGKANHDSAAMKELARRHNIKL